MSSVSVALVGAGGHGRWHRRNLTARHAAGGLRLAALCDIAGISPEAGAPIPTQTAIFAEHRAMLADVRPDVVVICTPPHTHLEIATDALRAGCDILLEKPPVTTAAEHDALTRVLAETGRACQVGFQALGSAALAALTRAVRDGRLGTVTGISAVASWQRHDTYYTRAPWAGRRTLNGRRVLDGALENPFAHAVMQCLAVAAAVGPVLPSTVEVDWYRTRAIEVDDTACLRVTLDSGLPIVVAVTLCGEEFIAGEVIVHGTGGRAVLQYPTDRLALPGDTGPGEALSRVDLMENLLAHGAAPAGVPLLAPLARTAPFTAVLAGLAAAPPPVALGPPHVTSSGGHTTISGINAALRLAAERLALLGELGVPWAAAPYVTKVPPDSLASFANVPLDSLAGFARLPVEGGAG